MLSEFDKSKGNLPHDFFKRFQSDLQKSVEDMDMIDLEVEAPVLNSLGKQTGFKVPEKYFENSTFYKIGKSTSRVLPLWSYINKQIAAAIIMILSAGAFMYVNQINESNIDLLAATDIELSYEDINEDDLILESLFADELDFFEEELEEAQIDELIEEHLDEFEFTVLEELL